MNYLDLCLEVVSRSCQPFCYIRRWISRKPLEIEAWFGPPLGNGIWAIKWSRDWWRHKTSKGQTGDANHCSKGRPIGNDIWGIKWTRDRWRHVTPKTSDSLTSCLCTVQCTHWWMARCLQCTVLCCKDCSVLIANIHDVFTITTTETSGPLAIHVNPGGVVSELITVTTVAAVSVNGFPVLSDTWYPGYVVFRLITFFVNSGV